MFKLFIRSLKNWLADDPFTHSAAAAYYAIFSFPGLIIIVMSVAALVFDQRQIDDLVTNQITQVLGRDIARSLNEIVIDTQYKDTGKWALLVGMLTLSFGATGLFAHLQRSLNNVFDVEVSQSSGIFAFFKTRLISFGMVLILGLLLLMSLLLTAAISLLNDWISAQFSASFTVFVNIANILTSFSIVILLFTLIYKILPDANIHWRSSLMGGILATILFEIGEYSLNIYFNIAEPESSFGAAGSLVLLMLWVSYSCMILLIGAEYCKVYEQVKYNQTIIPSKIGKNIHQSNTT
ncbi:MAG: YihY/virulence factor BrkB family protein [Methylophilaceae bacterium]